MDSTVSCPVCDRSFEKAVIEEHVNKCLFLNTHDLTKSKRDNSHLNLFSPKEKKIKIETSPISSRSSKSTIVTKQKGPVPTNQAQQSNTSQSTSSKSMPLAEHMRPQHLDDLVGHKDSLGTGSMLRSMIQQKKIPNMILWGPPGCGKTSLANIIATICKEEINLRFVKLSATMAGINDVKEIVKIAKNEAQFKKQTVLFMDEIHRFNKLQQDTFLPHVENGTIILIGATTENPSFSLNNALLSRCRVVVMEKLSVENVTLILERALKINNEAVIVDSNDDMKMNFSSDILPKLLVERASLTWLAEVCDGDARVALGALELALAARPAPAADDLLNTGPVLLTLDHIRDGIKRTHILYDRKGEEHYNIISAIQKSIRASDDNAALYWTTRALRSGEDPLYIARRLIRAACEDVGLGDSNAIVEAVACLQGCQHIGMPECDVLLAQCAVRLARAPKSTEVYHAMKRCQRTIDEAKGPLPPVPLHLRNAPTKLMKQLGYGRGYNTLHKEESGLHYMPEGMEEVDFFNYPDETGDG